MAEHAHTPSRTHDHVRGATSRRTALALTAGAFASIGLTAGAAATVADTTETNPDAELLTLGRELDRLWAQQNALGAHPSDEELDAALDAAGDVVDRIEHTPAHTLDGLRVKARAVSWCCDGTDIAPDSFSPYEGATTDARIATSIVRDLLRLT